MFCSSAFRRKRDRFPQRDLQSQRFSSDSGDAAGERMTIEQIEEATLTGCPDTTSQVC
jgi:hypothetical protein